MSISSKSIAISAGRYDGRTSNARMVPGGRAKTPVRSRGVQPVEAAVEDPYGGKERILVTVNRRVDLLELERSHGRLSEAAYRTGQIVQAVFERMGGIGTSNWCGTSRVDAVLAHEIKMIRMIESAERVQAMVNGIARHLGMIDMRLLRRVLGDRMSFAECAAFEGKGGDRGTSYVATRFRDALEDLAKAWAGKGRAPLPAEDRYADAAAADALASRQGSLQFSGRCAAQRLEPGAVIRIRVEPYQPGEPMPFMPAATALPISGDALGLCHARVDWALGPDAEIAIDDGRRFSLSQLKPSRHEVGLGWQDWVIRAQIFA